MPEAQEPSDAYLAAREGALAWLSANWDPGLSVRDWWGRLAESGWGFPTWPEAWFGQGRSEERRGGKESRSPWSPCD